MFAGNSRTDDHAVRERQLGMSSINTMDVVVLDKEDRWYERCIKESISKRVEKPSLNKKGGLRFNLSHTWDRAIREIPSRLSRTACSLVREFPAQLHIHLRGRQMKLIDSQRNVAKCK